MATNIATLLSRHATNEYKLDDISRLCNISDDIKFKFEFKENDVIYS